MYLNAVNNWEYNTDSAHLVPAVQQGHVKNNSACADAQHALDTSLNSRMPLGEEESKARRVFLFTTNSAMNLSRAVVTSGLSAQASRQSRTTGKCVGYSQSNSRPVSIM
jgi:hypothetical protein